jgi:hypothetical protein
VIVGKHGRLTRRSVRFAAIKTPFASVRVRAQQALETSKMGGPESFR